MIKTTLNYFIPSIIKRQVAIWLSKFSKKINGKYADAIIVENNNLSLAVSVDDVSVGWTLRQTGIYGQQELERIKKIVGPKSKVVFVGTHIGALAIPITKLVESSILVEANPRTYKLLETNLKLNQVLNAKSYNVAVGETTGEIEFVTNIVNSGGSKRKPINNKNMYYYDNPKVISVPMTTLDNICGNDDHRIDMIFMDIEGSEYFAIKGMSQVLKRTEAVIMEFIPHHLDNVAGCSVKKLIEPLMDQFEYCYIPSKGKKITSDQFLNFFKMMYDLNESDDGLIFTKRFVAF